MHSYLPSGSLYILESTIDALITPSGLPILIARAAFALTADWLLAVFSFG